MNKKECIDAVIAGTYLSLLKTVTIEQLQAALAEPKLHQELISAIIAKMRNDSANTSTSISLGALLNSILQGVILFRTVKFELPTLSTLPTDVIAGELLKYLQGGMKLTPFIEYLEITVMSSLEGSPAAAILGTCVQFTRVLFIAFLQNLETVVHLEGELTDTLKNVASKSQSDETQTVTSEESTPVAKRDASLTDESGWVTM